MTTEKKPCCKKCLDEELTGYNICAFKHCPCHASEGEPLDWKAREREKWHDTNEEKDEFGLASTMANEIADYWLARISAIREEIITTMEKTIIEQINSAGGLGGMNHLRDMIEVASKIARGEK